jgi:hypothetical protein
MSTNTTDKLIFSHPALSDSLKVDVKPDSITWSYNLNTQNYPTFGGEVVQILSMFIDDMTITGTVSSYTKMEKIYGWFTAYMQRATQGKSQAYDTTPVTVTYPHRGWQFLIQPKAAPGFRYGRDVVAPTWSITAAVVESPPDFKDVLKTDIEANAMQEEGFKPFGTATAEIGFSAFNPWSAPNTGKTYKEGATQAYYAQQGDANGPFNTWIKAWISGGPTFAESLGATQSQPALLSRGAKLGKGLRTGGPNGAAPNDGAGYQTLNPDGTVASGN